MDFCLGIFAMFHLIRVKKKKEEEEDGKHSYFIRVLTHGNAWFMWQQCNIAPFASNKLKCHTPAMASAYYEHRSEHSATVYTYYLYLYSFSLHYMVFCLSYKHICYSFFWLLRCMRTKPNRTGIAATEKSLNF